MWGTFDRLMSQLGTDSRYAKALSDDPELARLSLGEKDDSADASSSWRPAHRDWTMLHELLAQVRDLFGTAYFKDFDAFPRPESALESMKAEIEESRMQYGYLRVLDEVERAKDRYREAQRELGDEQPA